MSVGIRTLDRADIKAVAQVHAAAFPRQRDSIAWISCNASAYPRMRYFIAEVDGTICGFVLWTEKSGFRDNVVIELEQIAVAPFVQRQGIGKALIVQSLALISEHLVECGRKLSAVMVTTRADNVSAHRLYSRALGAKAVATIPMLFAADEIVLLAQFVQ